jgi:hypothetical protein
MNSNKDIQALLEKYLEGQTSLKEEKQLRYYFLFEEVDQELESYRALFQFYETEKQVEYTKPTELDKPKSSSARLIFLQYWKVAVAAVVVIGLGLSWFSVNQTESMQSLSHEEIVLAQKYLTLSLGTLDKSYARSTILLNNASKIDESTQKVKKMGEMYDSQRNQLDRLNYIDQSFKQLENITSIQKSRIKLVM